MSTDKRLRSLDVFRGATIAGMILVNSPGNEMAYVPLEHAAWDGCTPTDLIFPFFVFILGASLYFSLSNRLAQGTGRAVLFRKVLHRTAALFGLGLLLNGFPYYHWSTLRIPGVLQRIALCYFFAATLFLRFRLRTLLYLTLGILLGYWLLMTRTPVPGFGAGNLTRTGNLAAYVDRTVLAGHLYRPEYDPEGILSTLPAIATALMGILAGAWLGSGRSDQEKLEGLLAAGAAAIVAGKLWGWWFPINKALWTGSYVLYAGGWALLLLALCYWLIDVKKREVWGKSFEIFGRNAILAYCLHILFLKIQNLVYLPRPDGRPGNLRFYMTDHFFAPWTTPLNASLLYALSYTLFWLIVCGVLSRKKIFVKI